MNQPRAFFLLQSIASRNLCLLVTEKKLLGSTLQKFAEEVGILRGLFLVGHNSFYGHRDCVQASKSRFIKLAVDDDMGVSLTAASLFKHKPIPYRLVRGTVNRHFLSQ
jgi:hypothetical protein